MQEIITIFTENFWPCIIGLFAGFSLFLSTWERKDHLDELRSESYTTIMRRWIDKQNFILGYKFAKGDEEIINRFWRNFLGVIIGFFWPILFPVWYLIQLLFPFLLGLLFFIVWTSLLMYILRKVGIIDMLASIGIMVTSDAMWLFMAFGILGYLVAKPVLVVNDTIDFIRTQAARKLYVYQGRELVVVKRVYIELRPPLENLLTINANEIKSKDGNTEPEKALKKFLNEALVYQELLETFDLKECPADFKYAFLRHKRETVMANELLNSCVNGDGKIKRDNWKHEYQKLFYSFFSMEQVAREYVPDIKRLELTSQVREMYRDEFKRTGQ